MDYDKAYTKAKKLIEKARRNNASALKLNNKKLTALPDSLGQLTQLQSLDLSHNQLTALPEWLGQFTQLQSLDLSNTPLTALPESIGQLTQLQSLDLSNTQLTSLPESIGQLTRLEALNLSHNQLAALPEWLGQLTQLQLLNLSHNQLAALPEWLGQLTQLRVLNLDKNKLTSLPTSFSSFTKLQSFYMKDNDISNMPEYMRTWNLLSDLRISDNPLKEIPFWIGELRQLGILEIANCRLTDLPDSISQLGLLNDLYLGNLNTGTMPHNHNRFVSLPDCIRLLRHLSVLWVNGCQLKTLPDWLGELVELKSLQTDNNGLADLPTSFSNLINLKRFDLSGNPLNPELAAANADGIEAIKRYLSAKAEAQVVLNEAKLILVGEGEVGKSCLLGALRGDPWMDNRSSTHGIEIKSLKVTDPITNNEITLNGWDFGGQRVYRPTHQLFFSAPAVYLVVWKPREGPQQGFVKDWIKLVKHREPDAKILVVATHGGPKERQPDIDRQEIWDLFGKDTVIDFFHVDSHPSKQDGSTGACTGIQKLKEAVARVAAGLPEMGRSFPKRWQEAREALKNSKEAYLQLARVFAICKHHQVGEEDARLLLRICHRVGDLIHYEHDPTLRDIVVLKPDWLTTAISFVLDDKQTREIGHGLVSFARLGLLWNDMERPEENRYPSELHPIFLRLMERFDLSYRVAEIGKDSVDGTSLIAQLVPDVRPNPVPGWPPSLSAGDIQQVQICRIVDAANNQSATAEGLFFQLIVRLHKFSLGRANHAASVHWQRGLVLEDDTGARSFLEHIGNDVRITVRSPYPERFLSALTYEVKWLVESFWTGLRCEVTVPCLMKSQNYEPCSGLFEVGKLIENKKRNRPEQPCPICNEWQSIEQLLHNAPAARPNPMEELLANFGESLQMLNEVRLQLSEQHAQVIGRFDQQDAASRELVSKVEAAYTNLMRTLLDEAKDGPRLFSFEPAEPSFFDRPKWINAKFRVTLWCEHSRLPLPALNGKDSKSGVYELDLPRDWFVKAAPFLKVLTGTLGLIVPVASATTKLVLDEATFKGIENQLNLGEKSIESAIKGGEKTGEWLGHSDAPDLEHGEAIMAQGAVLRQLQSWLKEKDPSFGGLVRVQNKRQEFLWVHSQFENEY